MSRLCLQLVMTSVFKTRQVFRLNLDLKSFRIAYIAESWCCLVFATRYCVKLLRFQFPDTVSKSGLVFKFRVFS